ncbi:MAG: glycosyltransferase family 2 protein [bacterium]|nr:glycosyltransferase family 2 protein [bacterium]
MRQTVSFVIPAYNAESMLADAVESIFVGNFEEGDEVIVVNDASKDGTLAVANELAQKHAPHVRVINNPENKGCPASRNVGIREAKSDFIFNLDADNILKPTSIIALRQALADGADVAAFGEYEYFTTSTNIVTHRWVCKSGVFTLADLFAGIINQGPGGNFLYRKVAWERIGGYWEYGKGLHEAWGFSLKLLINGARFIVVPGTSYLHRYSHQSLFVRESKKPNEEREITAKFIEPALPLLSPESRAYVATNPDWHRDLPKHSLLLADGSHGVDGILVYSSPIKQALHRLKTALRI